MADREMTLEEWVERLPSIHRARKEYETLRRQLETARDGLEEIRDCTIDAKFAVRTAEDTLREIERDGEKDDA